MGSGMNEKINLVFCIDSAYVQHLSVTLASIIMHNDPGALRAFILYSSLEQNEKELLLQIGKKFNIELVLEEVSIERIAGLRSHLHISPAMYYRLLLPEILGDLDKVIYLDCDLVVETGLRDLWITDLNGLGCVGWDEENPAQTGRLDLDSDFYINSGVLVINLALWREEGISDVCLNWLYANPQKAILPDQDAINVVLKHRKGKIDVKWNLNPVSQGNIGVLKQYPERILHFGGPIKPWHKCYDFELQSIYRKYLMLTPWADDFKLIEPVNTGQACLVANQLFNAEDYIGACRYYHRAIDYQMSQRGSVQKLEFDCINGGHRHFNFQDYFSACEHYRSCIEHWGYPIAYEIDIYKMPGLLDNMF
jgi:lipopolysaccharide biosynthesis glycosyltransferase